MADARAMPMPSVRDTAAVHPLPPIDDAAFAFLAGFVGRHCGIVLTGQKRQLVQGRLARRLRELGLPDWRGYCERVERQPEAELDALVSAISTNVTAFFREAHHFAFLETELERVMRAGVRRIRLWSAGCSTGEEPYCMAMVLAEALERHGAGVDARILATDLSPQALAQGERGVYPRTRLDGVDVARQRRWFDATAQPGEVQVAPRLRELVRFRRLNLLDQPWPMRGRFEVIFCRNVVIYFDKPTKTRLFERFAQQLQPGGHLCIGHSESMYGLCDAFELVGRTQYRVRVAS